MSLMKWNDELSVNIAAIDRQHKGLIDLINRLHAAIESGTAEGALADILTDLAYYTIYHFQTEEKLFDEYDYPEAESHKKEHNDLVQRVTKLKKQHEDGDKVLSIDVMNFLNDWLQVHILNSDKKFGPFLNGKGVR